MLELIKRLQERYHLAFIVLVGSLLSYVGLTFLMSLEPYNAWFPIIPQLLHNHDDFLVAVNWLYGRMYAYTAPEVRAIMGYGVIYAHDALWVVIMVAAGKLIGEKRTKRDSEG